MGVVKYIFDWIVVTLAVAVGVFLGIWAFNSFLIYF